jgi:porin
LACALASSAMPILAADADNSGPATGIPTPSIATSLPQSGDPFKVRAALAGVGITYGANYIGEVLGNASGGVKRGALYEGRLELFTDIDFEKLSGWKGLFFHANWYQIHGHGLSANNLQNLLPVSYIEATPASRLFELWLEQKLFDDKLSIRFGQLAADSEFFTSDTAGQFINGTFGWPTLNAANLPSGGAAYPLATPGVRVKFAPNDQMALLVGVYNGDPAGPRCDIGDPQRCNNDGLSFRTSDPAFVIGELQFKFDEKTSFTGLPGTVKLGAWRHEGRFADQRFGTDGLTLATGNGVPALRSGNHALYGMFDTTVFKGPGDREINVFARFTGAPSDRNLIDFYADGGLKFSGFVPGRKDDTFGVGAAYAGISTGARRADQDNVQAGNQLFLRNYEALVEFSYTAQIVPGWTLQPDVQYIWHPGGRVDDGTGKPIGDAAVFGLRTTVNY